MKVAVIEAQRAGYSISQVAGRAITVGEMIEWLQQFDEDSPVIVSNDNGYTYGPVRQSDLSSEWLNPEE